MVVAVVGVGVVARVTGSVRDDAAALVARTCAAQGVPETVADPETLRKVAVLLRSDGPEEPGWVSDARSA